MAKKSAHLNGRSFPDEINYVLRNHYLRLDHHPFRYENAAAKKHRMRKLKK